MKAVKVTNVGNRTRDRLGRRFDPKQEVALSVNNRQLLTLRAVRDFEVEVIEVEVDEDTENQVNDALKDIEKVEGDVVKDDDLNYSDLNVEQVLEAVKAGKIEVGEAIANEIAGKNRATLLDKLEDYKQ